MRLNKTNKQNHVDHVNGLSSSLCFNWSNKMLDVHIDNLINTWGYKAFITAVKLNLAERETIKKMNEQNVKLNNITKKKVGSKWDKFQN